MGPLAQFDAFLRAGRFMLQRCEGCGRFIFSPRLFCTACKGDRLAWQEAQGGGTVYSSTIIARPPAKGGDYHVVLVDLDEGPRMMSRVVGVPATGVRIGMRVLARVRPAMGDDAPLIEFVPA